MVKVILPELSEGMKSAVVSYWYFAQGQKVTEKEPLVELTTDKAAFNLPSPATGVLAEIIVKEGDTVSPKDTLAIIDESV
jgi:pyruvate/2-oxoglutarate dehydrogenase complex dihydrolipoamide acyltransferase (E2) component